MADAESTKSVSMLGIDNDLENRVRMFSRGPCIATEFPVPKKMKMRDFSSPGTANWLGVPSQLLASFWGGSYP